METRICKTCKVDFFTFSALEMHWDATGHKGEIDNTDQSSLAFAVGGLAGVGIYKLWKRRKK